MDRRKFNSNDEVFTNINDILKGWIIHIFGRNTNDKKQNKKFLSKSYNRHKKELLVTQ